MKKYTDFTLNMMTKENLIAIIRRLEDDIDIVERMNATQFNLLAEKDLYRWHDLRKDPNDLPVSCVNVEVYYEYYHYKADAVLPEYGHAFYNDDVKFWGGEASNGSQLKILAWRYIEKPED